MRLERENGNEVMARILRRTQFGNPILRMPAKLVPVEKINSPPVQLAIDNMFFTLEHKQYGVGLAAPQVSIPYAVAVVALKPTPTRPDIERAELVLINPLIVNTYGKRTGMWEACISGSELYGKVPRYKKIRVRWYDRHAQLQERDFDGLLAHVIQHEVDHLNGILFVDKVRDPATFMTFSEYKKMVKKQRQNK